jgi:hypothetical protein
MAPAIAVELRAALHGRDLASGRSQMMVSFERSLPLYPEKLM